MSTVGSSDAVQRIRRRAGIAAVASGVALALLAERSLIAAALASDFSLADFIGAVCAIAVMALPIAYREWQLLETLSRLCVVMVAIVPLAMLTTPPFSGKSPIFWTVVVMWTAAAATAAALRGEGWSRLLLGCVGAWSMASLVMTAGETDLLPYSQEELAELHSVHLVLDLRLSLGLAFLLVLIALAVARTLSRRLQPPPDAMLRARVDDLRRGLLRGSLIGRVCRFALLGALVPIAGAYRAAVRILIFFVASGFEAMTLLRELFTVKRVHRAIGRVLVLYVLCVCLALIAVQAGRLERQYLLAEFYSAAWILFHLSWLFLLGLGLAWAARRIGSARTEGSQFHQGWLWSLGLLLVAGALLTVAVLLGAWFHVLPVPGPFVVGTLTLWVVGAAYFLFVGPRSAKEG